MGRNRVPIGKRAAFFLRKLADFLDPSVRPVDRSQLIVDVSADISEFERTIAMMRESLDSITVATDRASMRIQQRLPPLHKHQ